MNPKIIVTFLVSTLVACDNPNTPQSLSASAAATFIQAGGPIARTGKCVLNEKAERLIATGNWSVATEPLCPAGETAIIHN